MKKILVILNLIILMLIFGYMVIKEEQNLKKTTYYIKTRPVDPRSLMQGDYMILNYEILEEARRKKTDLKTGYIRVKINESNIAEFIRIDEKYLEPSENKHSIKFYKNGRNIDIGVNSYLFQEGTGRRFQRAVYSEVIELKNGNIRLKFLLDSNFKRIK